MRTLLLWRLVAVVAGSLGDGDGDGSGDCDAPGDRLRASLVNSPIADHPWPPPAAEGAVPLGTCAFVGLRDGLKGAGLGKEIDAHDSVVRIGRLPSSAFKADVGSRTTAYFWDSDAPEMQSQPAANASGVVARLLGSTSHLCSWHKADAACGFSAVLLGAGKGSRAAEAAAAAAKAAEDGPLAFAVSRQSEGLALFQGGLTALRSSDGVLRVLSAEMKALVTLAPFCETVKLYGFEGAGTLDAHASGRTSSDLAFQSAWIRRLAAGKVTAGDFALEPVSSGLPLVAKLVPRLMRRLSCQALAGKFSIAGVDVAMIDSAPKYWALPGVKQDAAAGRLDGLLTSLFPSQPFPDKLGRCAFIGSGAELSGKGRGAEIDAHDTVIRVNRLSTPVYQDDIGKKTDVLFINNSPWFHETGALTKYVGESDDEPGHECPWNKALAPKGADYEKPCPFRAMVWDRNGPKFDWKDRFHLLERLKLEASFPVAYMGDAVGYAMWTFKAMQYKGQQKVMSGGLKAFLSLAPLCDEVNMYGFVGSGNMDHHDINSWHDYGLEHEWLHRIASGQVLASDFTSSGDAQAEQQVYRIIPRLMHRLLNMGEAQKINIVGTTVPRFEAKFATGSAAAEAASASSAGIAAAAAAVAAAAAAAVAALTFRTRRSRSFSALQLTTTTEVSDDAGASDLLPAAAQDGREHDGLLRA